MACGKINYIYLLLDLASTIDKIPKNDLLPLLAQIVLKMAK